MVTTLGITNEALTVYVDGQPTLAIPSAQFPDLIGRLAHALVTDTSVGVGCQAKQQEHARHDHDLSGTPRA